MSETPGEGRGMKPEKDCPECDGLGRWFDASHGCSRQCNDCNGTGLTLIAVPTPPGVAEYERLIMVRAALLKCDLPEHVLSHLIADTRAIEAEVARLRSEVAQLRAENKELWDDRWEAFEEERLAELKAQGG
jgi:hypothetical protein